MLRTRAGTAESIDRIDWRFLTAISVIVKATARMTMIMMLKADPKGEYPSP
jgi:hypothetical protein